MKFLLKYNYNLDNPTIYKTDNEIYVKNKNERYLFYNIDNREETDELIHLIHENNLQTQYHSIIKNVFGNSTVFYKNKEYVLLKLSNKNVTSAELINEIVNSRMIINTLGQNKLDRSNWFFLWCKKNDYICNHSILQIGKNIIIDESKDYYIGLAENAIAYINTIYEINNKENLYISHKRIEDKNNNNPLNIVLDKRERDIAEYIKYLFFNNHYDEKSIKIVLDIIISKKLSAEKVYARLLYPTYYFDLYEEINKDKRKISELIVLISKIDEYEKFLTNIHKDFSRTKDIKKVDWLH